MSRVKLEKLIMQAFRGASKSVTIEFDPEKHITMIYGENGSGKSSIVDSFSFLSEKNYGSLEERSEANSDYITSITSKPDDLQITLFTDKGQWQAKLKPKSKTIDVVPTTGIPPVRILRRKNILDLIDTPSSERYKALQNYIQMPGIEKCEASLREAAKEAAKELGEANISLTQAQETLENLWKQQKGTGKSAEEWAEKEKARDFSKMKNDLLAADDLTAAIKTLADRKKDLADAISEQSTLKGELDRAEASLKEEEKKSSGQSADLVTLLEQAKTFVDATSPLGICPVCEQKVSREELSSSLGSRVESMRQIAKLSKAVTDAKKKYDGKTATVASEKSKYAKQILAVAENLKISTLNVVLSTAFPDSLLASLSNKEAKVDDLVLKAETWDSILNGLKTGLEDESKKWRESTTQQGFIVRDLESLRKYEKQVRERSALSVRAKAVLKIVEDNRKAFVTQELDAISGEFDTLFQKIHPDEEYGGIKLTLKDKFQHSLFLAGDFHSEKGITPQSLFSESHLDTLGLCVFLALAKKYRTEDTIVILDDVVTSVDQSHLSRFIDVLHDEADNFGHIIVTTHYGPWRELYRSGRSPNGELHFIDLALWTLEKGIRSYRGKPAIDELKETMEKEPFHKQSVASQAGILLESTFHFVNQTYRGKLPQNPTPGYTLRELTDGLPGKFLKLLRVVRITDVTENGETIQHTTETFLEPIITKLKGLAALRNQVGCHYNEIGQLCSESEVREFGEVTLQLIETLACPEKGDFPSKDKSGAFWESRSGKVQLHPLKQPAN